jgi:hypothetical protein
MLSSEDAEELEMRLEQLQCTDPEIGGGLFTYVFKREPIDEARRYMSHVETCEYCRLALELYRYKRHLAELLKGHPS